MNEHNEKMSKGANSIKPEGNASAKSGIFPLFVAWVLLFGMIGLVALTACGCCGKNKQSAQTERNDFVRIFMNNACSYTVLIKNGDDITVRTVAVYGGKAVKLKCDVPKDKPCWYEGVISKRNEHYFEDVTIHIHDPKEIDGQEYRYGKTTIQNHVIE